ncbi:MAG TPA: DUF6090 family protein, partial [Flavobacteriaceae bacterium]|nr:DUF6090 family protein [Flavobacteriaceae bacterium]
PMIKFFRKIRQNLISEGKTVSYLKYAIGEIVLVVIGILIALQINNWNQNNSNKKLEMQYYSSMKSQLNEDLSKLNGEIYYNQDLLNKFSYAKNLLIQKDKSKIDTLAKITLSMVNYADFRQKSNVFQTLVNSGEIKYINNKKILEHFQSLEENYNYINRIEESNLTVIIFQVVPEIKEVVRIDPLKVENVETLFSYQFQNGLELLIHLVNEKRDAYLHAKNEIETTIELIDQELALNNGR